MKKILLITLFVSLFAISCTKEKVEEIIDDKTTEEQTDVAVSEVNLDKTELTLTIGEFTDLKATVLPKDSYNKNVVWSSNNNDIASVEYGQVTALKEGEAIITVKTLDGNKTATCKVTIKSQVINIATIELDETDVSIVIDKTHTLSYNISPVNATDKTVVWTSNDESIASVDNGIITAKAIGTTTISVSSLNGEVKSECIVNVTKPDKFGTFIDERDGKEYKTVRIGDQIWMAENLAYLPQVNKINEGGISGEYYYVYDYNGNNPTQAKSTTNYAKYGVLYNWDAAQTACPEGWHLATDEEWKTLEIELGMSKEDADKYGDRGNISGKLKDVDSWGGTPCSNESGFTVLPAGELYFYKEGWTCDSEFMLKGRNAKFWTATTYDSTKAYFRFISDNDIVYRRKIEKEHGYSVRCVKDKE